jgi:DNA-binding protein HU-beta
MTKKEWIAKLSEALNCSKTLTEKYNDSLFDLVAEVLCAEGKLTIPGFGTFKVGNRMARTARNPQTQEAILIPARKVPVFKPAPLLKEKIAATKKTVKKK